MVHGIFTVLYITSKNSFCHLSDQNSKYTENGVTLKLSYGDDEVAYLSPQTQIGLHDSCIGINRLQAHALGLSENDSVIVEVCNNVPGIRRLTVSPATKDDYDILELFAENIELTLLNQIRVVNENQKFVIWVTGSLHVTVNVDSADPVNPGRLDNLTEVVIAPPKSEIIGDSNENATVDVKWSFQKIFNYFTNTQDADEKSKNIVDKFTDSYCSLSFSLHPVGDLLKCEESEKVQYFNAFVLQEHLPKNFPKLDSSDDIFNFKIIIPPVISNNFIEESGMSIKTITLRLCILESNSLAKTEHPFPVLYVNECVFRHFGLKIGSKAFLDNHMKDFPSVNSVEIKTTKRNTPQAVEKFKLFVSENQTDKLLLNSDFVLKGSPNFLFSLKFTPANVNFCLLDSNFVRNCKFTVSDSELISEHPEASTERSAGNYFENFGNFKKIVDKATCLFEMGLTKKCFKPENVLIVGKPGTGKSTLADILSCKLSSAPFYIHSQIISCKKIKGKSLDSLQRVFFGKILSLIYYQPSVLIFDDLNITCEKVTEGDALTQEALHFNRVSEMIAGLLENIQKYHKIAILATSESVLKLNQHVFASRGQHLFKNVFTIGELTKDDRTSLLNFLFDQKCTLENVNTEQFSLKTEGFVVQDLIDFVDKAIFESLKEEFSEKPKVTTEHCDISLQNTTALSLKDVQLHSPGDRDFSDIGGLEDVKKILVECMMWPVQYPNLFGNAPLRLQSGLLLYGPPGTGKTILAGAAAKHCGLRLISIKGPELLSKYIGASEQAVRNVFEKAQSAKPCILFFDEFDSLAPRRGHDSTGVTDRVVNQLLTQLDGIESLNGVCVLAATSRPDLLDPALLRPGRLDRQILCPLPGKDSRFEILKSLSKKMFLASDVDLLKIAKRTEGYSGADLQAILYTAQLSAVEYLLEDAKEKTDDVMEINQNHLEEALNNTRPSLTKEENLKYKRIYSKFQQSSDLSDFKSGLQKATLA